MRLIWSKHAKTFSIIQFTFMGTFSSWQVYHFAIFLALSRFALGFQYSLNSMFFSFSKRKFSEILLQENNFDPKKRGMTKGWNIRRFTEKAVLIWCVLGSRNRQRCPELGRARSWGGVSMWKVNPWGVWKSN